VAGHLLMLGSIDEHAHMAVLAVHVNQ